MSGQARVWGTVRGKIICLVLTIFVKRWFCNGYAIKKIVCSINSREINGHINLLKKR